jgi:hypothetical protein
MTVNVHAPALAHPAWQFLVALEPGFLVLLFAGGGSILSTNANASNNIKQVRSNGQLRQRADGQQPTTAYIYIAYSI